MENNMTMIQDELEEDISDKFLCCVCLELLYKPIVLSCGHLSCFWCVSMSMNGLRESHCPICRDPYVHFPSVCQKLHFLLKKIYPVAHKKREEQVLKEEQEKDCFSPQIDVVLDETNAKDESPDYVSDERKVEECSSAPKLPSSSSSNGDNPCIPKEELTDAKTLPKHDKFSMQLSKDDLLCTACTKLLARPVVLNCGHVYCEECVVDMADEGKKIKCQECHVCDPRGFPKVCLVLEQLLEENFPEEYISRRSGIQKTFAHNSKDFQSFHKEGPSLSDDDNELPAWANPESNVHIGAGCDSCGVYPIIGERYRCKDCKEEVGYDLCKDCYETSSKVPGRFNQQHTPDHTFELADVPQRHMNFGHIGILIEQIVNTADEEAAATDGNDESEEGRDSNESSSNSA